MISMDKLYVVRLLWIQDPKGFAEYQELVKPIFAKHGLHIERWLVTEDMHGDWIDKPDQIVVTWFESLAAKEAIENDPDFKKAAEIRDRAVKMVAITAKSVFGD